MPLIIGIKLMSSCTLTEPFPQLSGKPSYLCVKPHPLPAACSIVQALTRKLDDSGLLRKGPSPTSLSKQRPSPSSDRKHLGLHPHSKHTLHFKTDDSGLFINICLASIKHFAVSFINPCAEKAKAYTLRVVHILLPLHIFVWTISWEHKTQRQAFNSVVREFQCSFLSGTRNSLHL